MSFRNKKKQKFRNSAAFEKLGKLEEAHFLIEGGKLFEALEFLEDAVQKYPSEARFWELLAAVSNELKDISTMQKAFAELMRFQPNNADARFGLAYSYALDSRLALAFRGFQTFLQKFPTDENLDDEYWDERIANLELIDKISSIPSKLFGRRKKK